MSKILFSAIKERNKYGRQYNFIILIKVALNLSLLFKTIIYMWVYLFIPLSTTVKTFGATFYWLLHCALLGQFCMHAKMFAASASARVGSRTSAGVSSHTHTHTHFHIVCIDFSLLLFCRRLVFVLLLFAVSFLIITQTAPMPAGIFNRVAAAATATASASSARAVCCCCCCGCCLCPRRG